MAYINGDQNPYDLNDTLTGTADDDTIYGIDGNDTIDGGAGNDALFGGSGFNTITGGAGNDYIGSDGPTEFIFGSNFGHDVFTDYAVAANVDGSTIRFDFNRPADLSLQRAGDDLFIVCDQGTLRVTNYFGLIDETTNHSPYTISFLDDTLLVADIQQAVLNGGSGDDFITVAPTASDGNTIEISGGDGSDVLSIGTSTVDAVIDGGSGDDVIALFNAGSTTLNFGRDSGRDFIYDAHGSQAQYTDVTILVNQDGIPVDAGDLAVTYQDGLFSLGIAGSDAALVIDAVTAAGILGDTLTWDVDLGSGTVSVKALLLAMPEIASGELVIAMGDGSTTTTVVTGNGSASGNTYDGTANTQNETVLAYMSDVVSGTDNETFLGVIDTATFNSGFGQDVIVGSTRQIVFEDDVADFAFTRTSSDLTITNTVTGDSLLLQDYFLLQTGEMRTANGANSNLTFNGITLGGADAIAKLTANNTGSVIQLNVAESYTSNTSDPDDANPQTFYADLGSPTINGGAGDNTIYYGTGTTVIHDTSLGGHDVLLATTSGGAGNTVRIKVADVTDPSSITMSFVDEDILISNTATGSTLLIDESYMTNVVFYDDIHDEIFFSGLGRVGELASELVPGYFYQHTYSPSLGNRLIESTGTNTDDVLHAYINVGLATWVELDGKGGDDTYIGAVSSEIFDYYTGSNTTILGLADNTSTPGGYDIVDMSTHATVDSSSLATDFSRDGNDLVFNDGVGSLTIKDFFLELSVEAGFEDTIGALMTGSSSYIQLSAGTLQALGASVWMQLGSGIYDGNYSPASVSHVVDAIQFSDRTVGYAEIAAMFPDGPGDGDDTVYGTENPDELHGYAGNDTIYGHAEGAEADDLLNGADDNDTLYGDEGDDTLYGANGNDTLDGGSGSNTLVGGLGDDSYVVSSESDVIVETAGEGHDQVMSTVSLVLADNVEDLTLTGSDDLFGIGNADDNIITGNAGSNLLDGGDGSDVLFGAEGDDMLTGGAGDDTLYGGDGGDTLQGDAGSNTLAGGAGDDLYLVSSDSDVVVENDGEGYDLVISSANHILGDHVEDLVLTGSDALNGTGNAGDNILTGNDGANVLDGAGGSDVLLGGDGADTLLGGAGDDMLFGGDGNDSLTGGIGLNTLTGGAGDDNYYVSSGNDSVVENDGEGLDTVYASVSYTNLGDHVENLTLTGSALNGTGNAQANTITGNGLANLLNGGAGADTLVGGDGNDTYVVDNILDVVVETATGGSSDLVNSSVSYTLGSFVEKLTLTGTDNINGTGNSGNNTITGNSGNNVLNGNGGTDVLVGGAGDDTYYYQTGVTITENAGQGLNDTVISSVTGYTLGSNLEHLVLATGVASGNGNAVDNDITGNDIANTLNGGNGNDRLFGGSGGDTLLGGSGNDQLFGGVGSDNLQGGTGNDTYVLNRGDGSDIITEGDATVGNADVARFGSSGTAINHDQLWFKRVGNNLEVSVIGSATADKFTITGWYQNASPDATVNQTRDIEQFVASDGYTLTETQVQGLVSAMAGFTPPPAGTTTLDPGTYGTVLSQIAVSWAA